MRSKKLFLVCLIILTMVFAIFTSVIADEEGDKYYPNTEIPSYSYITGRTGYDAWDSNSLVNKKVYSYQKVEGVTCAKDCAEYVKALTTVYGYKLFDESTDDKNYSEMIYQKDEMMIYLHIKSIINPAFMSLSGYNLILEYFQAPKSLNMDYLVGAKYINMDQEKLIMNVNDSTKLNATLYPINKIINKVTWVSSNPDVASVTNEGEIVAKKAGTTKITLKSIYSDYISECTIEVLPQNNSNIENGEQKNNEDSFKLILTIGEKSAKAFGKDVENDVAPIIRNDRTMLPARFVAENLGAKVLWDEDKQLVTVSGKNEKDEDVTILITIGADTAIVNGEEIKLDSPAFIENDRTYTPVRFIAEQLGTSVEWNEEAKTVTITK